MRANYFAVTRRRGPSSASGFISLGGPLGSGERTSYSPSLPPKPKCGLAWTSTLGHLSDFSKSLQSSLGRTCSMAVRHQVTVQGEDTMSKTSKVTVLLLALLVAACASAQSPTSVVKVPDKLKPGANESLAMIVSARGVQVYECRARKDQVGGYEWAFVAPEADLFDARGNRAGRHYAGPHWEATDGSKILGTVKERADAPVADAIPWHCLPRSPSARKARSAR